jgi:PAS domain S-box-containing protein
LGNGYAGKVYLYKPGVEKVLGYKAEEVIGKSIFDFLEQGEIDKAKENIKGRIKVSSAVFYEYKMLHKNGNIVEVEVSSNHVNNNKNELVGFAGVTRDVTKRKEQERELKETNKKFSFLLKSSEELACLLSVGEVYAYTARKIMELIERNGYVSAVSFDIENLNWKMQAFEGFGKMSEKLMKIIGIDPMKMEGRWTEKAHQLIEKGGLVEIPFSISELTHGIIGKKIEKQVNKLINFKSIHCISFKHEGTLYGNVSIISTTKTPELNKNLIEAFINEVSVYIQKLTSEEARRESESNYRNVIENSLEGIFILQGTKAVFANPTIFEFSGYSEEEIGSVDFINLVYEEDRPLIAENNKRRLAGEKLPPYDFRIIKKNGEVIWVRINATLIIWKGEQAVLCFLSDINDRKIAENRLKESEQKYRNLFEKSSDPMLILQDGKFTDCNQTAVKVLNFKNKNDIVGKEPSALSPKYQPDGQLSDNKAKEMIEKAFKNGYHKFDWVHQTGDGISIWFSVSLTFLEEENKLHTVWLDISVRKKTAVELEKNRQQLQNLFDHMTSGFAYHKIIVDKNLNPIDYVFLEVNNAFLKMTGLSRTKVIGKKVSEVIPGTENEQAGWVKKYGEVAMTGEAISFEEYSEGFGKWFHVNAYSPEKGYFATTFEDISDIKNTEKELKLRDMHFTSLLQNPSGYVIYRTKTDKNYSKVDVTHVSPSIIDVIGIDEKDLYNFEKWFTIVHPDDLQKLLEANQKGYFPPFKFSLEFRINHPDKGERWLFVRSNGIPFQDEPNKIEYANGLIIDITDQKNAEEKLRKHQESLSEIVKDRTKELEEKNKTVGKNERIVCRT